MNTARLKGSLEHLFITEKQRIVFWHDAEREFEDTLPSLELDGVEVVRLDEVGALELKIRLELDHPPERLLLYAPFPEPEPEKDWLLDVRLYSRTFHADRASMLLGELGLNHLAMRSHLAKRKKFFSSQERLNRLKKWVSPEDTDREIDLKILAILTRADQPDPFSILMRLLGEMSSDDTADLDPAPKSWNEIEKYDLTSFFWELMGRSFGYIQESPGLPDLLIRLFVTDFVLSLNEAQPPSLKHLVLPGRTLALNASVFLSQWRNHTGWRAHYDALAGAVARELKMEEVLESFDEEALAEAMTFEAVERRVIRCVRDKILEGETGNGILEVIQQRRDGHWAGPANGKEARLYSVVYDAMEAAADLLKLRERFRDGLSYPHGEAMFAAYTRELYRLFHEAAGTVELGGWDVLKPLKDRVEACYSGWAVDQMAATWGSFVEDDLGDGLIQRWSLPGVAGQQDFFKRYVKPVLDASPKGKVYVLVSDAFRYEAAEELVREINAKKRFSGKLESMLGVLPTTTALGMAALLPHENLAFKSGESAEVLVDGLPGASLEQRAMVLKPWEGTAVRADQLIAMSKDAGREFVRPWRVIYVYHNTIDAVGDSAASESRTFQAVRSAIVELAALASFIINSLNGSQVLITADHGFLYQESPPTSVDKSGLDVKPSGALRAKKRYLLGRGLGKNPRVWHGKLSNTASFQGDMEFWIPRGANRFHFMGGASFVHGGAMLQEVVIPVALVKELRGEAAERKTTKKVDVSLLGSVRKVTSNIQRFDFIQTEAVSERVLPRTLAISLRDGEELISNEAALTFDSASAVLEERKKSVKLTLRSGQYDKKQEYHLVLRDAETRVEVDRIPMTIDLAFMNDF